MLVDVWNSGPELKDTFSSYPQRFSFVDLIHPGVVVDRRPIKQKNELKMFYQT